MSNRDVFNRLYASFTMQIARSHDRVVDKDIEVIGKNPKLDRLIF